MINDLEQAEYLYAIELEGRRKGTPAANSEQVAELVARLREGTPYGLSSCQAGEGCELVGACYAKAVGHPERCGRPSVTAQAADALASMQRQIDAAEAKVVELDLRITGRDAWWRHQQEAWLDQMGCTAYDIRTLTAALDEAKRLAESAAEDERDRLYALFQANARHIGAYVFGLMVQDDPNLGIRHAAAIRSLASQGPAEARPGETEQEERV